MKKNALLLAIFSMILMSLSISAQSVVADYGDPYTIYGIVKDENGIVVAGAQITVENSNTKERSSVGGDTITGNPIPVTTDSDGIFSFELINLKNGFSNGDEIIVTAERDGLIGSESTIVDNGTWGANVDITMEIEEEPMEKDQWYASLSEPLTLLLLIALIIAVILILILLRRGKGTEPQGSLIEEPVMREETPEEEAEEEPEPEHVGRQIEGAAMREETSKEVAEEEPEPDGQSSLAEEGVVYECPECGDEIKAEDTKCSKCGVAFAETED
jgi:hypothetical protein